MAIESKIAKVANVHALTQKESINIRDIDETVVAEEVAQAINEVISPSRIRLEDIRLRQSYRGTQEANVLLPAVLARKLLKKGKLRVSWVNCRIRLRQGTPRCYKCHETGHLARDCKSEIDRSAQCYRCGKEGHKAVECPTTVGGTQEMMEVQQSDGERTTT